MKTKTKMKTTVTQYLKDLPPHLRRRVRKKFRDRLQVLGQDWPKYIGPKYREVLADSVFEVEDHIESKNGGRPDHEDVEALNKVRNELYDDLRWNDEG